MKRLGILQLHPGWDVGPSLNALMHFFCFHFRDEKEKEREGDTHEADALSKYNNWTKDSYTSYLTRFDFLHSVLTRPKK